MRLFSNSTLYNSPVRPTMDPEWVADRSDQLKYSYLTDNSFGEVSENLHENVLEGLKQNNYTYMTQAQKEVSPL
jgi:hypothetical protein